MDSQARRLEVLAAQLAAAEGAPADSSLLSLQPTAAAADPGSATGTEYSVVLPESLTSNNWVVRRQVPSCRSPPWRRHVCCEGSSPCLCGRPAQLP